MEEARSASSRVLADVTRCGRCHLLLCFHSPVTAQISRQVVHAAHYTCISRCATSTTTTAKQAGLGERDEILISTWSCNFRVVYALKDLSIIISCISCEADNCVDAVEDLVTKLAILEERVQACTEATEELRVAALAKREVQSGQQQSPNK